MNRRVTPPSTSNLAAIRSRTGILELNRLTCPDLAPGDVRLRILRAAICGTDRQIVRGDRRDRAPILGHEGVTEVAAVGTGVRSYRVGERFVFNPVNPDDQDEILGHSTEGIFQQYLTVSERALIRRSLLVRVPRSIRLEHAVLAEPLGTVIYTHEILASIGPPRSLLIVGAGSIGILHALYARRVAGVPTVRILCKTMARADWLRHRSILPADEILVPQGTKYLQSEQYDTVLLCVPARAAKNALQYALGVVTERGCVGLIGSVGTECDELPGVDLAEVRRANSCGKSRGVRSAEIRTRTGQQVRLFGQRGTSSDHLRAALTAVTLDPVFACILTHRVTLNALPGVCASIGKTDQLDGIEYIKAIVNCASDSRSVELIVKRTTADQTP